jgi:hypothetical protein
MPRFVVILLMAVVLISSFTACGQPAAEKTTALPPSDVSVIQLDPQGYYGYHLPEPTCGNT